MWRNGPTGKKTLCNACGIAWTRGKLYGGVASKGPRRQPDTQWAREDAEAAAGQPRPARKTASARSKPSALASRTASARLLDQQHRTSSDSFGSDASPGGGHAAASGAGGSPRPAYGANKQHRMKVRRYVSPLSKAA
jgi:hypothetical protein